MGGLSGLGGLGSLAAGFQQGVGFVQDVQHGRQRKKALDYTLNQMGREDTAAQANSEDITDEERGFYGDDTTEAFMPEVGTDPFLYRMMDMMTKRRGKKKRKGALAGAPGETGMSEAAPIEPVAADAETMPYADPNEGVGLRDGGSVDDAVERAKQNRARTSARGESTTRAAMNDTTAATKTKALDVAQKAPGRVGGVLRGAAAGGAALAGIAGAVRGYNTPTEDYAERMGLDPASAGLSFWKDVGIRSAGVMSDVGAAAGDMVGLDLRSRFADVQRQQAGAQPQAAAGAAPRTQALPAGNVTAQAAVAQGGHASPSPARTAAPAQPQPGDALDMSNLDIDASELPDIKMSDWKRYRAQALRSARLKGLPQAQALEEADRMVTTMQIRGFSNYAAQSQALLQAGNVKGAMRSLRAAYQYFPDGNDVKIGVHKGKLVAVGVDEGTGEPFEGGTRVITPEFLAGAIQNFQNPQNFLAWTQDWRNEAFKEKQYNEVTKPLAEAQGQALRTNSEANVARSEAAQMRATMSQRGGGLRPSDMRGSEAVYRERLSLLGVTDEAQADQFAAVMSQIKQANPQVPDNMIVDFVMKAKDRPDGAQFIQRALSGQ
jgi:hypothetical protein